jgi:Double zinc ribbon
MAVCSSCGSEVSGSSKFCTVCGKPVAAAPAASSPTAFCTTCGAKLSPGTRFCTGCGAPVDKVEPVKTPESASPITAPTPAPPAAAPVPAVSTEPSAIELPQPSTQPAPAQVAAVVREEPLPAATATIAPEPQPAPAYRTQPDYAAPQLGGGKFRTVIFILILVIVACGLGGWYFWGVETIVVCSPPEARVFIDGQELSTTTPGRYVIPHLSRKAHLLKVQSPGFADTIQRLDFPLTSLNEWVNVTLPRSGQGH